jgi:hypothetical protein
LPESANEALGRESYRSFFNPVNARRSQSTDRMNITNQHSKYGRVG